MTDEQSYRAGYIDALLHVAEMIEINRVMQNPITHDQMLAGLAAVMMAERDGLLKRSVQ